VKRDFELHFQKINNLQRIKAGGAIRNEIFGEKTMSRLFWLLLPIFLLPSLLWGQDIRVREDADALLKPENKDKLDALKLAFKTLQESKDPKKNMTFWANIHGAPLGETATGPCEHNSELIWPWHRAYLYQFETALRESNPPMTSNVTLPYWNWAAPPSGDRYPKIFEEPGSPLNYAFRTTSPSGAPLPSDIEDQLLSIPLWIDFGGDIKANEPSPGALELQAHNPGHGFIGGHNNSTARAARDPIFWAHHTNLDRIWIDWTAKNGEQTVGVMEPLRGLPGTVVKDWLDVSMKYKYGPKENLTPPALHHFFASGLMITRKEPAWTKPVQVPALGEKERMILQIKKIVPPKESKHFLAVDVYLHPEAERFDKGDAAFRRDYRLTHFALWDSSHAQHAAKHAKGMDVHLDVTTRFRAILKKAGDKKLAVSVQFIGKINDGKAEHIVRDGDTGVQVDEIAFVAKSNSPPKK
jgi:hypothetical protein